MTGITERQRQVIQMRQAGHSREEVAQAMGISVSGVKRLQERAQRWVRLDPVIQERLAAKGYDGADGLHSGWIKDQKPDGTGESLYFYLGKDDAEKPTLAEVCEDVRAAFEGMKPAPQVAPPEKVLDDLCAVYTLYDVHMGMRAWAAETGGDPYDLRQARLDLSQSLSRLVQEVPPAHTAVLVIGGDFFHGDDTRNVTPASKHPLDVDGRYSKALDDGVEIIGWAMEWLLQHHEAVVVRTLRGNHDEHSHHVLRVGIRERYRGHNRVDVRDDPKEWWHWRWGEGIICFHHGDRTKPEALVMMLANNCPGWSDAAFKHAITGHVHHYQARDIYGCYWESLRAFCPLDSYAASKGFAQRRALECRIFHRTQGLKARHIDAVTTEERAAA